MSKVTSDVHWWEGYAYSLPSQRIMRFQDSYTGLNNPTREAAVVTHEYAHIVSETYNSLTQNAEANAMDEAYSDYFGLAYINQFISSSAIGEYIDQAGGYNYTRNLVNNRTMSEFNTIDLEPDGTVEEHDRSVIFSGGLWDFRRDSDVNSSIADELVLESLNNLGSSPTFLDGRDALKAAANASGYSAYTDDIDAAFVNHGIGLSVTITGPTELFWKQTGTWTANPSGGSGYTYEWRYRDNGTGDWSSVVSTAQTYQRQMPDNDIELQVKVTSGGAIAYDTHYVERIIDKAAGSLVVDDTPLPKDFMLTQNFPNPFNPETTIRFDLPQDEHVQLLVIDLLGREVRKLADSDFSAGHHSVIWDGEDNAGNIVPSGVYIYQIVAGVFQDRKKLVLVR